MADNTLPEETKEPDSNTEEVKSVDTQWSEKNLPKGKDEWNKLRTEDPVLWGDLSQQNYDKMFRENKELQEKNSGLENQRNNLTVELDKFKTAPVEAPDLTTDAPKEYSTSNLPKSQQEWDDLAIENPTRHVDLRFQYNQRIQADSGNFEEAQATSRKIVQAEHPEMYLAELDESGQPKKDEQGKFLLQVDEFSGEPKFDPNSEKGKLWLEIYNKNPNIASNAQAPELMMASMERQLRVKGEEMVDESKAEREQAVQEGQVVQEGVQPPKTKVEVTFKNDEEKRHAEGMVNRGLYKNLEDYVTNRDTKDEGIHEANSLPFFNTKK